jgi:hypothetical protein
MRRVLTYLVFIVLAMPGTAQGGLASLFPEQVSELARIQLISGAKAQQEVDKLHGKALEAAESAVARYARAGERPAEVWVSKVSSKAEARRQTGLMVHKMYENPKSPFKNPSRIEHMGVPVYRFTGMGQVHLIYFMDDLVYWISANPDDQLLLLDAFCR